MQTSDERSGSGRETIETSDNGVPSSVRAGVPMAVETVAAVLLDELLPAIEAPSAEVEEVEQFDSLQSESEEMHDAESTSYLGQSPEVIEDEERQWQQLQDVVRENGEYIDAEDLMEPHDDDMVALEEGDVPLEDGAVVEVEDDGSNDTRDSRSGFLVTQETLAAAIREVIQQSRHNLNYALPLDRIQQVSRVIFGRDRNQRNRNNGEGDQRNAYEEDSDEDEDEEGEYDTQEEQEQRRHEDVEPENPIRFDTNLPAEHSYLGANMDRVSGVDYLDVGQQYHMMLFMHQHILFPGEVLPFMISGSIIEADIDAQNGLLFGVCFAVFGGRGGTEHDNSIYGVTCQIYEKGTDDRGNTLIKSRALQRFVTRESEITGPLQFIAAHPQLKCYGNVQVLPEIYLPEPLKCINMGSMNRFRDCDPMRDTYRRFQAATTPWPAHIYNNYSITAIIEKARTQLAQHKIDTMPRDPTQLSFWLVRNLHLSEAMMKSIFVTDSVNTRMKLIASTFKEEAIFTCRYCENRIANCCELFAMSKHGVQTQYCNSAGFIHETNTVYQLLRHAVSYSGEPSTEFSWFPGYQWHIIVCKICSRHIGWEFKAVEPNLVPRSFFGISSSSVRVSAAANVPTNPRATLYRNFMTVARRELQ